MALGSDRAVPTPHCAPLRQRPGGSNAPLRAGVDRRGHFRSVGDITTAQIFGLKQAGIDADDLHVPLMAVPQARLPRAQC
jgi:hypothetical protein